MLPFRIYTGLAAVALVAVGATAGAQVNSTPKANWSLANRFTPESLRPFVYSGAITPNFINKTDSFWYTWRDSDGVKFWRVDPAKRSKTPLFDTAKLAALLSE